jgi:hypothetical protein
MTESWTQIEARARALVDAAGTRGLILRVVGSTGIRLASERTAAAMDACGRQPKDIDVVCRGGDRTGLRELLEADGWTEDRDVRVAMEGRRLCFAHGASATELDVFVDRLEFCHTIELGDRLTADPVTIPLADLLLQKLQVHDLTRNDLVDATALMATHGATELDVAYIAELLGRDWGFHHTAMANLEAVRLAAADGAIGPLDAAQRAQAAESTAALREAIDGARKTMAWKMRARVGERMQWWEDVNERVETY